MNLKAIKSILKENKEFLKGKKLQVGYNVYQTLRDFEEAIVQSSKKENNGLTMVLTMRDFERCSSEENSLRNAFKHARFDAVKVSEIPVKKEVNLDYSNVDFTAFGTTA